MDQTPARIYLVVLKQPLHRPRAPSGLHFLNFGHLLSQVHMDRPAACRAERRAHPACVHRAQRMRRNADCIVRMAPAHSLRRGLMQPQIPVGCVAKALLPAQKRAAVASAPLIQHRQKRQAYADMLRCCNYALGKLAKVAIGRASNVVMQVMKLGHARVARLQHLKENLRCNRLDVLGREAVKVAIHQAPPCPEAVRWVRPSHLGQARHRPLKRVAVQVHRRRQKQIHRAITGSALRTRQPRFSHPGQYEQHGSAPSPQA